MNQPIETTSPASTGAQQVPAGIDARSVYAAMSIRAHTRTSQENVGDVLEALASLSPAPASTGAGEAVAWRYPYRFKDIGETGAYEYHSHEFACVAHLPRGEPLYTHPAPSPVAQGCEPIKLNVIRHWPEGFQDRLDHVWRDLVGFVPNYKLFDLQRMLTEFGFRMEVYESAALESEPAQGEQALKRLTTDVALDLAEVLRPVLKSPEDWALARQYATNVCAALATANGMTLAADSNT